MDNTEAPASYSDAYAKVFASPARDARPWKASYAELMSRRSPSPACKGEYYSSTPKKSVSVLHRPQKPESMKNIENMDVQHEKDKGAFEKRANTYRRLAGEKYHHNRPSSSILTLWEAGHIVDRGRGRPDSASGTNPINHTEPESDSAPRARPQSAPHRRPVSNIREQMGSYDPICHSYTQTRDPAYEAQKERELNKLNGTGNTGIAIRVDPVRASFDPILGQNRHVSPAPQRPSSASVRAEAAPASPEVANTPAERPATPGRRRNIAQGDSWGTYNPILHSWATPPRDSKFKDQNQALIQREGISGTHVHKPEPPRNQGVYNPILNSWVVPPANTRVMAGLSFAPATMFSRASPSSVKA